MLMSRDCLEIYEAAAPSATSGLVDVDVTGGSHIGTLVGNISGGEVIASYSTERWTAQTPSAGWLGDAIGGEIIASYSAASVRGTYFAGGLVGFISVRGGVSASYATGTVRGVSFVGGLAGGMATGNRADAVNASYATGLVFGSRSDVGGLVGSYSPRPGVSSSNMVSVSYWDTGTTRQSGSVGGLGKITSDLQSPTAYGGIYSAWNVDLDNADNDNDPATNGDRPVGLWDVQPVPGAEGGLRRRRHGHLAGIWSPGPGCAAQRAVLQRVRPRSGELPKTPPPA